jgi:dipeptidyl aminopeptidase/acylaminoacyl peptidase
VVLRGKVVPGLASVLLAALLAVLLALPALSRSSEGAGPAPAVIGVANDTTTPFNLVDVGALLHRDYDGDGPHLQGLLYQEPAFDRWALTYRSGGLRITGTLAVPRSGPPAPLVVVAHGFASPGRYFRGSGLLTVEDALARAGFAVLHPDYRNYAGSSVVPGAAPARPGGYPVDLLDAVAALRRAPVPGVDLGRIGLLGRSMGGAVAMQAAVARPGWFKALQLYSPVSSAAADELHRWAPPGSALRRRVVAAYGTPASRPGFWARASVRSYFSRLHLPVEVAHGTRDPVCPYRWSVATVAAMRRAGVDARLVAYPGERHGFNRLLPRYLAQTVAFFDAHLR